MVTTLVVGKALALQCADRLHPEILKTAEFKEKNYENALIKAFVDLDQQFITGILAFNIPLVRFFSNFFN